MTDEVWQPTPQAPTEPQVQDRKVKTEEEPSIIFFVAQHQGTQRTESFSLTDIVRYYCKASILPPLRPKVDKRSIVKTETKKLYDILGLLRAIRYDIKEYNANSDIKVGEGRTKNDRLYGCFRLTKLAAAFRVQLPPPCESISPTLIEVPGLETLISYIETEFQSQVLHSRTNLEQGVVDFDSLAEYFQPGRDMIDTGLLSGLTVTVTPLLVRCRSSYYNRGKSSMGNPISTFHASVEFVVATGPNQFAVVEAQILQSEFQGTRRIDSDAMKSATEMLIQPDTNDSVWRELENRGRQYERMCCNNRTTTGSPDHHTSNSGTLVNYSAGSFFPTKTMSGRSPESFKGIGIASRSGGRVMIDIHEAWQRGIHAAKSPADGMAGEAVIDAHRVYARLRRQKEQQQQHDKMNNKNFGSDSSDPTFADDYEETLNSEILFLRSPLPDSLIRRTWPVVCGFSFPSRSWGLALVDGLSPISFHENGFDSLVLPAARKRLLRALISTHGARSARADALPGKGEGIIFLLHGSPGVGKTLTAESVAEVLHRPLYRVSMGELGTTPETLEERLQEIFDLCLPWHSIVLIDEAEMLLETRSNSSDLVRNAMVCVMLRLLEYYPGILFLTTNSGMDKLDPAIASRLTCALHYEALDRRGRFEIWKASLQRVQHESTSLDVSDADLEHISASYTGINGRQIKNAVQLATSLCLYEGTTLTLSTLLETLEMTTSTPSQTTSTEPHSRYHEL